MTNRKFMFFAMLALIFGMAAFGVQQTRAAKAALNLDGGHHGDHDDDDDDDDDHAVRLLVDNDLAQCPNAQYTTIQSAVNAAPPGAVILVCPGTYPEEVRVSKPLTIRGIRVGNENLALINPPIALQNTTSLASGNPVAAIILVERTTNVTLDNLTVDGAANLINLGCAPNLVGIFYRNASGKITNAAVRNIRLFPATLSGCQSGLGIFAQSGDEPGVRRGARLEVLNTSVHDYQKNGITGNDRGTELTAYGNAVTGFGPTPAIAQNGIQIGFGAKGRIEANSVINHIYSLCTPSTCSFTSSNILAFASGSGVRVLRNNLGKSQVNVYFSGDFDGVVPLDPITNGLIEGNTIYDSDVFDGVAIVNGNNNTVRSNSIFNSDEAAVWIDGNNNRVNSNTFNEAPIGIFNDGTGNNINGNRYFNIAERILPTPTSATALSRLSAGGNARNTSPAQP